MTLAEKPELGWNPLVAMAQPYLNWCEPIYSFYLSHWEYVHDLQKKYWYALLKGAGPDPTGGVVTFSIHLSKLQNILNPEKYLAPRVLD